MARLKGNDRRRKHLEPEQVPTKKRESDPDTQPRGTHGTVTAVPLASKSGAHFKKEEHVYTQSTRATAADVQTSSKASYSREHAYLYQSRSRKARSKKRRTYALVALLLALLLGVVVFLAWWIVSLQNRLNNSQVVDEDLRASLTSTDNPSDPYYVLLMGTDGRPGESAYRADSIILCRVDPQQKKLALLSIPRDTRVVWKGSTMKINGVHTYDGAAGMVQIVSQICHVSIAHYAEINFDGLAALTDALGGVTLTVDEDMVDTENFDTVTSLSAGEHTLNGEEALFYTRNRNFPDGDFTRMRHQRTYISAVIKKIMENFNPATIVNVINSLSDMVITDLSVGDIVSLAAEMRGIDTSSDIYTAHVPSEPAMIDGLSYLLADWDKLDAIMKLIDAGQDPALAEQQQDANSVEDTGQTTG